MQQCDICGKKPQFGQHIRHQHSIGWKYEAPRKKRRWIPNLQTARVAHNTATKKIKVCTKCMKAGKVVRATVSA